MQMIKKLNWGAGIVIGMATFMLFIITLAGYMMASPSDDFDTAYYEKGLAYDNEYNRQKNVVNDNATPQLTVQGNNLLVVFSNAATGQVNILRPSNGKLDHHIRFSTNTQNQVTIPLANIAAGSWQLVLNWQTAGKQYLYKKEITLP